MESVVNIYKIGNGPSSSHTMGPNYACQAFLQHLNEVGFSPKKVVATLFSSLAWTGKGHLTDVTIKNTISKVCECEVKFDYLTETEHPNTLKFVAEGFYKNKSNDDNKLSTIEKTYLSIGGGNIIEEGETLKEEKEVYPFSTFKEFVDLLNSKGIKDPALYIRNLEDPSINDQMNLIIDSMIQEVENGFKNTEPVALELNVKRVAKDIYNKANKIEDAYEKKTMYLTSFAYAASEENAGGGVIVTAPTAGSCGVMASAVYYALYILKIDRKKIIDGLLLSGLIGLIIKNNASISGAVCGCQAEIGSASSMASAFFCYIDDLNIYQIGYASEVSMEHSLGLTCDPVNGYVAIPCIERNAIGILKAYDSYLYAKHISEYRTPYVSFDDVIKVMYETGIKLHSDFKETSKAGLAKIKK